MRLLDLIDGDRSLGETGGDVNRMGRGQALGQIVGRSGDAVAGGQDVPFIEDRAAAKMAGVVVLHRNLPTKLFSLLGGSNVVPLGQLKMCRSRQNFLPCGEFCFLLCIFLGSHLSRVLPI